MLAASMSGTRTLLGEDRRRAEREERGREDNADRAELALHDGGLLPQFYA